jgi:hypothetical protein
MERKMADSERGADGRFKAGWTGGPGRPRRATEADYLRVLSDAVPLDQWEAIVRMAVESALIGDPKAREWLTKHLLGVPEPGALQALAVDELTGRDRLADAVEVEREAAPMRKIFGASWKP